MAAITVVNLLKPNSSNCYILPYKPYPPFFNFWYSGTLALSPEHQSAWMSEIINGKLGPYGAEQLKCNHMIILGYKRVDYFSFRVTHSSN